MEEKVRKAIKTLKKNRAHGMDEISTEIIKPGGEMVTELMHGLCNHVLESGDVPEDWKNCSIVCIPKKSSLECDNWRGVTLLSIPGKMYIQMILNCIWDKVDDKL